MKPQVYPHHRARRLRPGLRGFAAGSPAWSGALQAAPTAFVFTRTGVALARQGASYDAALYNSIAQDLPRFARLSDGAIGFLGEGARTNRALRSSDFSNAVWSGAGSFTRTSQTSLLPGVTALQHRNTNVANAAILQTIGTFTGSPETLSLIVENVDALTTLIAVYNSTTPGFVARATLTWATEVFFINSGTATLRSTKLSTSGPNGGKVMLLSITVTSTVGNGRQAWLYPAGTAATALATTLHHAQYTEAAFPTSPIITAAAAAARNDESCIATLTAPGGAFSVLLDLWTAMGVTSSVNQVFWQTDDGTTAELYRIYREPAANHLIAEAISASSVVRQVDLGAVADNTRATVAVTFDPALGIYASLNHGTLTAPGGSFTAPTGIVCGRWHHGVSGSHSFGHLIAVDDVVSRSGLWPPPLYGSSLQGWAP